MTLVSPEVGANAAHPIRSKFGRRKFDKQPTQSAAVLIASNGFSIPAEAINKAIEMSGGEPVAVVTIARIYGSAMGLPNPGLMPSRKEMSQQKAIVEVAVQALERKGVEAWGQIAASRKPVKTIVEVAKARSVRQVIIVRAEQAQWRKVIEGDLAKDVAKRLDSEVAVEGVSP